MNSIPQLILNDGNAIPAIGFGTWPLDDQQAEAAVRQALASGYRLIDTASRYGNEKGVGLGLAASDVPRKDIVLTTKLRGSDQGYDQTLRGFDASVKRLGLDYVDLYLIHWPLPARGLFPDSWKAMVRLRDEGRIRSIGVSNFQPAHIRQLIDETGVTPAVNQIELHPDFAQSELRDFHKLHGIVTEAWSPLGRGEALGNAVVAGIAEKHRRMPAQVILRWEVQLGIVPIPKSANPARIAANRDVFDFTLDADDMAALAGLDRGHRLGGDPDIYEEF